MNITQKVDAVTQIGQYRLLLGGYQPPPKSVKIELTARCVLRCKFCALHTRHKQTNRDMSWHTFKRIAEDCRMCGIEEIGLFYLGESFMVPHLLADAVHYSKQILKFPWVFLTTNGVFARPKYLEAVMSAGLDSLKFSVNYHSPQQFETVTTGHPDLWKNALENIRIAREIRDANGYKTLISASSIYFDKTHASLMKKVLDEYVIRYVDKHYWLPLYSMGMSKQQVKDNMGYIAMSGNPGRLDETTMKPNRDPIPCWAVFTEAHVRVDGNLSACCFGADDKFDMGKLDGRNFMYQWNSEKFRKLREAHIVSIKEGPKALMGTVCEVCAT